MAKRRILKKDIASVAGELFAEALICKLYIPGVDSDKADAIMARVLDMHDDYVCRAGNPNGKDNRALIKDYYRKLKADLQTELNAIAAEIGELGKGKEA